MAIFKGVKNFFGYSTLKIELDCPDSFSDGQIGFQGRVILTGLSEQEITKVRVELVEEWTDPDDQADPNRSDLLGYHDVRNHRFLLREGERVVSDFSIALKSSGNAPAKWLPKGGVLGAAVRAANFLQNFNHNITYKLVVRVNVKSAAFDPTLEKTLFRRS